MSHVLELSLYEATLASVVRVSVRHTSHEVLYMHAVLDRQATARWCGR